MAGFIYEFGRESFLGGASGQINWTNDTIKAVIVANTYVPNSQSHQYVYNTITAHTAGLTAQTLASKTNAGGVADAADITFATVANGTVFNYICIFKDSGSPATSPLIALLDSGSATGLPLTSSGGDINIVWNNGANRIFKL